MPENADTRQRAAEGSGRFSIELVDLGAELGLVDLLPIDDDLTRRVDREPEAVMRVEVDLDLHRIREARQGEVQGLADLAIDDDAGDLVGRPAAWARLLADLAASEADVAGQLEEEPQPPATFLFEHDP